MNKSKLIQNLCVMTSRIILASKHTKYKKQYDAIGRVLQMLHRSQRHSDNTLKLAYNEAVLIFNSLDLQVKNPKKFKAI